MPTMARRRLASFPKCRSSEVFERVIASFDRTTLISVRDQALLLRLTRVGLRAGDVADLTLGDLDWHAGAVQIAGKNRR
jgi:site-specific recombinase XerC